jgi:D-alanyl-D-alanine carboxypeptidase
MRLSSSSMPGDDRHLLRRPAAGPTRRTLLLALTGSVGAGLAGVAAAAPAQADAGKRSPNGWPVSSDPAKLGVTTQAVPGTGVRLAVVGGAGGVVLLEAARRFSAEVERLTPSCWGYAYRANTNDPGVWSNHASGTAIDLNSAAHPNGATRTFTSDQVKRVHRLLHDLDGVVRWGGDYSHTVDAMHFELDVHPGHWRLRRVARRIQQGRG